MESKSMWTIAMLGFCAVLLSGVFAFINMGYMEKSTRGNLGVVYGKMSIDLAKKLQEQSHPIESTEANLLNEGLVEVRYRTRKFLSFAPAEMDKEFIAINAVAQDLLPGTSDDPKSDPRELLLIRQEVTGGGCNEQVRQSTKLFPVAPKKRSIPVAPPGDPMKR